MNSETGEVVELEKDAKPESEKWLTIGSLVEIRGGQFRVTDIKPNGRLFLKFVKKL